MIKKSSRRGRRRSAGEISRNMSAIRSRDNRTELALRKLLHRKGLRYRLHVNGMPGRPDIVFPRSRVAVFVDGDYWHGRLFHDGGKQALLRYFRRYNRQYWIPKIMATVERDRRATELLEGSGWEVLRFWEGDVRLQLEAVANTIYHCVTRRLKR